MVRIVRSSGKRYTWLTDTAISRTARGTISDPAHPLHGRCEDCATKHLRQGKGELDLGGSGKRLEQNANRRVCSPSAKSVYTKSEGTSRPLQSSPLERRQIG